MDQYMDPMGYKLFLWGISYDILPFEVTNN